MFQDLEPFQSKWTMLIMDATITRIFKKSIAKLVLVANELQDESACARFINETNSYGNTGTTLTTVKAKHFVRMANQEEISSWFHDQDLIDTKHLPRIYSSDSFCSAIVNGKGDDLLRFLRSTNVATDIWPSLLSSNSFIRKKHAELSYRPL